MLYPLMLLGLLGLAIPVIIHLIQRQRLRPQQLATLRFLDPLDVANAFAPVPRDWLQLLLRLLLLLLFILLMARLVVGGRGPAPRTLAVILDQSLSQQQAAEGAPLFQRHQRAIADLIAGLGPDDKMALLLVGDRVAAETGYLGDRAALQKALDSFQVSDGGGLGLVPAIRQTVNQLRSRREQNSAVLVFSDQQHSAFEPYLAEAANPRSPTALFAKRLDGGHVRLLLIAEPVPAGANLAIASARFAPERVYLGSSARLTAEVRNLTPQERTTRVFLFEGSQAGESRSLTLASNETARLDLAHRFESPVDSACRVELEDDRLNADHRFHVPMRMRERRQVLLVAPGEERDAEAEAEVRYRGVDLLAYALNPGEMLGAGAGTYIQVRRVTPNVLGRLSLPLFSVVVLYGLAEVPAQSVEDLAAFARSGGGVVLIPDAEVAPRAFNEAFAPLLNGTALGQLREPESPAPLDRATERIPGSFLLPLARGEWADPRDIHFAAYFGLDQPGAAQALLRAENGDPLAVLLPLGRGHVLVQLFSCDLAASSLPRTAGFVPAVQEAVATLAAAQDPGLPDLMRVGDVLRLALPEYRGLSGDVAVAGPESVTFPLRGAERDEIEVAGLTRAGAYEVSHPLKKSGRKRWLAVNPAEGESVLSALTPDECRTLFGRRQAVMLPASAVAGQFRRRHEVFPFMAAAVLLAFLAEALVGAWMSRRAARQESEAPVEGGAA